MADLMNELVWSHSRARLFAECKRAYWFNYYGSWGGWERGATTATRDAYLQKKLTSIAMWIGTRVHGAAELVLKRIVGGSPPPSVDEVVATTLAEVRRDIRRSADGSWLERPARNVGFREHYYAEIVEPDAFDAAAVEIERQVRGLFENRIFRRMLAVPGRILEVEQLQRFTVGDADVWATLDVLMADGAGGVVVVDWKTGGGHSDEEIGAQLGVYGLYAVIARGVAADKVQALHVNLRLDTVTKHTVGAAEMAAASAQIVGSVAQMRAALVDVAGNIGVVEDFPPLPVGAARCATCPVRGVCGRTG